MCLWLYYDRGLGFDELAMRFAVYFSVFTFGMWGIFQLLARRHGAGR